MGAAAVFETAAETPPTADKLSATAPLTKGIIQVRMRIDAGILSYPVSMAGAMKARTYSRNRPRSPAFALAAVSTVCVAPRAELLATAPIVQGCKSISHHHRAVRKTRHGSIEMELVWLSDWEMRIRRGVMSS